MRITEITRYPLDPEMVDLFRTHMVNRYGDYTEGSTGYLDFADWNARLDALYSEGGTVYRVLFIPRGSVPRSDLGRHWSMKMLDDDAMERLYRQSKDFIDSQDHEMIIIKAATPARNVTIKGVNVPEEYLEYEVNLVDPKKIKVLSMERKDIPATWSE